MNGSTNAYGKWTIHLYKNWFYVTFLSIILLITSQSNGYLWSTRVRGSQPTTNFGWHSFSTVLKWSDVSIEMIPEQLGHSLIETTQIYLDSSESGHNSASGLCSIRWFANYSWKSSTEVQFSSLIYFKSACRFAWPPHLQIFSL
jgi:hypothetical protein